MGGECKIEEHYVAPTLLSNITSKHTIMQDEIFGPILPIITYQSIEEVITDINSRPIPLASYIFSTKQKNIKYFLSKVKAGGGCINDAILHFAQHHLPFGGFGNSGLGKSHGVYGFNEFTNIKGMVHQSIFRMANLIRPPYNNFRDLLSNINLRWF